MLKVKGLRLPCMYRTEIVQNWIRFSSVQNTIGLVNSDPQADLASGCDGLRDTLTRLRPHKKCGPDSETGDWVPSAVSPCWLFTGLDVCVYSGSSRHGIQGPVTGLIITWSTKADHQSLSHTSWYLPLAGRLGPALICPLHTSSPPPPTCYPLERCWYWWERAATQHFHVFLHTMFSGVICSPLNMQTFPSCFLPSVKMGKELASPFCGSRSTSGSKGLTGWFSRKKNFPAPTQNVWSDVLRPLLYAQTSRTVQHTCTSVRNVSSHRRAMKVSGADTGLGRGQFWGSWPFSCCFS